MMVKKEKYYKKEINKNHSFNIFCDWQNRKRTSYWLFGIIPIYIKDEVISGDYER